MKGVNLYPETQSAEETRLDVRKNRLQTGKDLSGPGSLDLILLGHLKRMGPWQRAEHQGQPASVPKRRKTEVQKGTGIHSACTASQRLSPAWNRPCAPRDNPSILGELGEGLEKGGDW